MNSAAAWQAPSIVDNFYSSNTSEILQTLQKKNLDPPMEHLVPEIDAAPATKNELVEALNLSASYEDSC